MDKQPVGVIGSDGWPKLEQAAKVGAATFYPGVSSRVVVEAALRQYQYSQEPAFEAERLEKVREFVDQVQGRQLSEQAGTQGELDEFNTWAKRKFPIADTPGSLGAFSRTLRKTALEGWMARALLVGTSPDSELSPSSNRYGVDADYFRKKLHLVLRDFASFKPDELARALFRLGKVADESVLAESEFLLDLGLNQAAR